MLEKFEDKTIMLVDDDQDWWLKHFIEILTSRFESTIQPFSSFSEAETHITNKSFNVDLIILDLINNRKGDERRGEKKGLELARYIKANYKIPIIIVTLNKDLFDALEKEGYSGVFYKENFSRTEFIKKIETELKKQVKRRKKTDTLGNRKGEQGASIMDKTYSILDNIAIWYPANSTKDREYLRSRALKLQGKFLVKDEKNIEFVNSQKVAIRKVLDLGTDKISQHESVANIFLDMLETIVHSN